ncbi:hypothetical protein [Yoonia sp. 2307UL14-13]|uniref:hypothetical protein n=1 Tax=Yoonia sp. 2307UL14-13 TaxID=3126506 RepID=UPI0030A083A4
MISQSFKSTFDSKIRPTLFGVLPIILFGWFSLQLFFSHEPDWFARLGSAMVAYAILQFSVRREQHGKSAQHWDRYRVVAHLNQIRELVKLQQDEVPLDL